MKRNLLFSQTTALGKRLAMVLTMLLMFGIGQAWGAEGDVLKTYDTNSSTFASGYSRKTGDNFVWWGQKGFYGANNATNHGNLKPTAADLPVVKAQSSSATTSTTGLYYLYTSEAVANVGKVEVKFTAKSGSSTVNAYIVSSSTKAASGSATWTKVTLASNSSKAQGANVATAATYTFTFDATETDAKYYGVVFVTSSYWRATNLTFKLYEGAPVVTEPYTVNFYKTSTTFESVTEKSVGAGVTPPSMEQKCGDWTFQGWSESYSDSETSTTELNLVTLTNDKYYPTAADVHLYPVYSKTISSGSAFSDYQKVTTNLDDWSGKYLLSTGTYTATGVYSSNHLTCTNGAPGNVECSGQEFTLSKVENVGYSILMPNGNYLGYSGSSTNFSSSPNVPTSTSTTFLWTPSTSGISNVSATARKISTNNDNTDFRPYSSPSSGIVYLYKRIENSSTTYYYSYPSCTAEPTRYTKLSI